MSASMLFFVSTMLWIAASLQGITGFGFMILAVPGLLFVFPAKVVVPGLAIVYIPLGIAQMLQLRRNIDWRLVIFLVGGATVTLPFGAIILKGTDSGVMQRYIGLLIIGLAFLLKMKSSIPFRQEKLSLIGIGLISGIMATSTSISGPPVVLLGLKQRWKVEKFRATLITYFLFISLFCLPFHWKLGLLNVESVRFAFSGLPGLLLGFWTSIFLRKRVQNDWFRWLAFGLLIGNGLAILLF